MKIFFPFASGIFFFQSLALATVEFNCYSLYNAPPQAYAVGSLNCPIGSERPGFVKKDGDVDIICVFQAMCESLAPGERPTVLTPDQVVAVQMTNSSPVFKASVVSCAGKGKMVQGSLQFPNCPPPNECRRDVLFTAYMAPLNVGGLHTQVIKPNLEKSAQ